MNFELVNHTTVCKVKKESNYIIMTLHTDVLKASDRYIVLNKDVIPCSNIDFQTLF